MKRAFVGILLSVSWLASGALHAADAVTLAAQQEMQDNHKRLTATIEEYQTTQVALQKQISALSSEVSKLRDELARNSNDNSHKESVRQLGEQIRKVDEARITDNKRIQEALERLGETIKKMPASTPPKRPASLSDSGTGGSTAGKVGGARASTNSAAEEGFEYEVVSGDRPDVIAAKYQAEKIKVTARDIINANKNVDWTKLKIGQKLFIPKPKAG
ncbi:MAG TPA: LysM peptidoglycan-binding domain-containing protein [Verrucomicrobiae bacterium]